MFLILLVKTFETVPYYFLAYLQGARKQTCKPNSEEEQKMPTNCQTAPSAVMLPRMQEMKTVHDRHWLAAEELQLPALLC